MSHPSDSPEVIERFEAGLELVNIIAKQLAVATGKVSLLDDLIGYGREGLLTAARRFDPSRGVPFRAFASYRIRGAVLDGLRAMAPLPRRTHERLRALEAGNLYSEGAAEDTFAVDHGQQSRADAERALGDHLANMATAMATGLLGKRVYDESGEVTTMATSPDPENAASEAQLLRLVKAKLVELPPQEAELVRRHYLEGDRFDHVARDLGLSKSWASRLHTRALARLTEYFRDEAAPPEPPA